MMKNITILCCLCLFTSAVSGQAIDNTLSYANINSDKYLRLNVDNDYFTGTDQYYTYGMHAEVVDPWIKKFPLSKLLVHPGYSYIRYGLGLEQDAYTPINDDTAKIIVGDRPFASSLMLKTFLIAIDPVNKQRFSATLSTGIIGVSAGGMAVQSEVHTILPGNSVPQGWPNQVRNDAILNYQVDYEKQLLAVGHILSLDADGMVRAGTLSDKAALGATIMTGYFDSPFGNTTVLTKNFRVYAYDHAEVDAIGYDATLEGGVFNRTSPYTIRPAGICRFTAENRLGVVVVIDRMSLEYATTILTREFITGQPHAWGSVQICFTL